MSAWFWIWVVGIFLMLVGHGWSDDYNTMARYEKTAVFVVSFAWPIVLGTLVVATVALIISRIFTVPLRLGAWLHVQYNRRYQK